MLVSIEQKHELVIRFGALNLKHSYPIWVDHDLALSIPAEILTPKAARPWAGIETTMKNTISQIERYHLKRPTRYHSTSTINVKGPFR